MSSSVEINEFIKRVSKKYNIDEKELVQSWNTVSEPVKVDHSLIRTLSKSELVAQCKVKNLKISGTKEELIARLTGEVNPQREQTRSVKPKEDKPKEVKPSKNKAKPVPAEPKIFKNIQTTISSIKLRYNSFGNCEHRETGIVFDKNKMIAIGKQSEDGRVLPLMKEDYNICNQYKLPYVLPDNLISTKKDVVVEELGDENLEEFDEEEVEELEEEEEVEEEEEEAEYEDD